MKTYLVELKVWDNDQKYFIKSLRDARSETAAEKDAISNEQYPNDWREFEVARVVEVSPEDAAVIRKYGLDSRY